MSAFRFKMFTVGSIASILGIIVIVIAAILPSSLQQGEKRNINNLARAFARTHTHTTRFECGVFPDGVRARNLLIDFCFVSFFSHRSDAPPVWEVTTVCNIPNESHKGTCQAPDGCPAYTAINDPADLSSVGRLSFLKQVQCNGTVSGQICCPRNRRYE